MERDINGETKRNILLTNLYKIYIIIKGVINKGMILKVNDYSYEVVIVTKDKIEQIIITDTDMWRMRKIV